MKRADLQEGRLYVVDHFQSRHPRQPARLIHRGDKIHTFAVAEDPEAEVRRFTVEFQVESRKVEREWTEGDDRLKVERAEAREREAQLESMLAFWFEGIEGPSLGRGYHSIDPTKVQVRVGDGVAIYSLSFFGAEACERVLHALTRTYGVPEQKQLTTATRELGE